MSMTKDQYHDEINEARRGMGIQWEPYIFKYMAQFAYQGEIHTLFGDDINAIQKLGKDILGEEAQLQPSTTLFEFIMDDIHIPILLLEIQNPRYY